MTRHDDALAVDESIHPLLEMLASRGIALKQKRGYKAGKLTATRNWCQFMDADMHPRVWLPNSQGQLKTWKLFARFDASQPPSWPWDRPSRSEPKTMPGMISGDDVWGLTYEDVEEWMKTTTHREILKSIADALQTSFNYSVHRYR
jgi:hypothetical protein